MSIKTQKILIITAVLLLVFALGAVALLILDPFKDDAPAASDEIREETVYNEDGSVKRVVYYKGDEYYGQKDYYSEGNTDYIIYFDKDENNYSDEVFEKNSSGSVISHKKTENTKTVLLEEYSYADDGVTLKKYTSKSYDENDNETALKLYYADDGETVTERVTFLNGKELTRTEYTADEPYKGEK